MKAKIQNYIRAGYPGIYITSHEESRVEREFLRIAQDISYNLWTWSVTEGLVNIATVESLNDTEDPVGALEAIRVHDISPDGEPSGKNVPNRSIIIMRDFHMFLNDPNPVLIRKLKDTLSICKSTNRTLVVLGCQLKMQPEIEKCFTLIEYQLPDREQLLEVLTEIAGSAKVHLNGNTDPILDAASGLTTTEAEDAFALSIVEAKDITPEVVYREKSATVRKNGLLEIVDSKITLDDIGGLENLKADLIEKKDLFTKTAREYGLPTPRGLLVVGQPGTGKSLTATATRNVFNIPLLRLEAGKLFGSLVGESERNWRTAFATAKAVSPCILWIDEVDGLFTGSESSGRTDGGTTARVIKAILQDMQMNSDGIFFMFTANDVDGLPDPLVDRLDVWSVDLPNATEREAIWAIQIAKRGRKPKNFKLAELASVTDGFSGRQIEQVWIKAMTVAFNDSREPVTSDVTKVASLFTPTSVLMAEAIEKRRKRLQNRSTPASKPEAAKANMARKIAK